MNSNRHEQAGAAKRSAIRAVGHKSKIVMADEPTVYPSGKDTRECPTCGTDNPPDETACSLCGSPLLPEVPHNQYEADEAEEPTLISPPPSSPLDFLPSEEDFLAASQAPTAGPFPSLEDAPTELDSPLASLPPTVNTPPAAVQPPPQAVPLQAAPLPPTVNTPAAAQPPPQAVPQQSQGLPQWIGLAGGALGLLLLLFIARTMLFQGSDESGGELTVASDQELAALQPDEVNEAAPSLPSPDISQLGGQVQKAEELLPIQLYGIQASEAAPLKAAIQSHIAGLLPQLQTAYNDSLTTDPQLSGAVVLEFSLAPDGQVSQTVVHPTGIQNVDFLQTVQSLTSQWSFRPIVSHTAAVTVFYPVLVTPSTFEPATFLSHLKEVWPGRYKVLSAAPIPVHAQSNETVQAVGTIKTGLFVYVISSQDDWLGVLSPTGKVGYVRREHLFPRAEG